MIEKQIKDAKMEFKALRSNDSMTFQEKSEAKLKILDLVSKLFVIEIKQLKKDHPNDYVSTLQEEILSLKGSIYNAAGDSSIENLKLKLYTQEIEDIQPQPEIDLDKKEPIEIINQEELENLKEFVDKVHVKHTTNLVLITNVSEVQEKYKDDATICALLDKNSNAKKPYAIMVHKGPSHKKEVQFRAFLNEYDDKFIYNFNGETSSIDKEIYTLYKSQIEAKFNDFFARLSEYTKYIDCSENLSILDASLIKDESQDGNSLKTQAASLEYDSKPKQSWSTWFAMPFVSLYKWTLGPLIKLCCGTSKTEANIVKVGEKEATIHYLNIGDEIEYRKHYKNNFQNDQNMLNNNGQESFVANLKAQNEITLKEFIAEFKNKAEYQAKFEVFSNRQDILIKFNNKQQYGCNLSANLQDNNSKEYLIICKRDSEKKDLYIFGTDLKTLKTNIFKIYKGRDRLLYKSQDNQYEDTLIKVQSLDEFKDCTAEMHEQIIASRAKQQQIKL